MRVCPRCSSIYATKVQWCGLDGETLIEQPQDPLVGSTLDRYQIIERLGEGGMGCVYRATHAVIDKEYAIKVLFGDFAGDQRFHARFRREAQAVSKIRHQNIVTVEDFGTTSKGLTFLAMQMVHGRTLEDVIEEEGPLQPDRVGRIVRQIAAGLGAAHQLGFVHRDVKPSNIMLTDRGDTESVKILDFGAVSLREMPNDQRLTGVGHIIGTPTYMAPEQCQDPAVGPQADLYALGVIMYEMLTKHPPFEGSGRADVLLKHLTEEPPMAPQSRGLERLIHRLLMKRPEDRPQTADEVIRDIEQLPLGIREVIERVPSSAPTLSDGFHTAPTNQVDLDKDSRDQLRRLYREVEQRAENDPFEELTQRPDDALGYDAFPALGVPEGDGSGAPSWGPEALVEPLPYAQLVGTPVAEPTQHAETPFTLGPQGEFPPVEEEPSTTRRGVIIKESTPLDSTDPELSHDQVMKTGANASNGAAVNPDLLATTPELAVPSMPAWDDRETGDLEIESTSKTEIPPELLTSDPEHGEGPPTLPIDQSTPQKDPALSARIPSMQTPSPFGAPESVRELDAPLGPGVYSSISQSSETDASDVVVVPVSSARVHAVEDEEETPKRAGTHAILLSVGIILFLLTVVVVGSKLWSGAWPGMGEEPAHIEAQPPKSK